jgi:hypothetical protein
MNTSDILLAIDLEISRLEQAKELLTETTKDNRVRRKPGRIAKTVPSKATSFNPAEFVAQPKKRRKMTAAGRARIAAAQRARWAKHKKETPAK